MDEIISQEPPIIETVSSEPTPEIIPEKIIKKKLPIWVWTIPILFIFVFLLYTIFKQQQLLNTNKQEVSENIIPTTEPTEKAENTQIANPASVNCIEKGGKLSIVDQPEGQVGMCTLPDGTICDEWLFFRGECATPSPVLISGTEKAIQTFLANKYKKPISEVKVIIQKEAPGFAAGRVSFGQDEQGEGGMWLAVAGNQWDVVWDGNGAVDCNKMRQQYGFPDTILKPNFCD